MITIEELKFFLSPKDVSYNLTKSQQGSATSVDYSRSSRLKNQRGAKSPLPPWKIGLIAINYQTCVYFEKEARHVAAPAWKKNDERELK